MTRLLLLAAAAILVLPAPAHAQIARGGTILINEFQANPPGTDPTNETFEFLIGAPGITLTTGDVFLTSIENDGVNGTVDRSASVLGTSDANGLLVATVPDLENPSYTLILSSAFTATVGDDLDADNDGVIDDLSVFGTIYDVVGVSDAAADDATLYSTTTTFSAPTASITVSDEPEIVFRSPGTLDFYTVGTIGDATSIRGADGTVYSAAAFDFDPSVATTFGAVNPMFVGEPGFETSAAIGWRQLGAPETGIEVNDLAIINLVSGAGDYTLGTDCTVGGISNLFVGYSSAETTNGFNGYEVAVGDHIFEPGQGFFWYFFGDTPVAGEPSSCSDGVITSTSQALPVSLPLPSATTMADYPLTFSDASDDEGFYLIANPFETAFDVSGITAAAGTTPVALSDGFQAWDPELGDYVVITADALGDVTDADADDISIWQGIWAERVGADPAANVTITFASNAKLTGVDGDEFYARRANAEPRIAFQVTNGEISGAASQLRFVEGAGEGWDRSDLSKIGSLNARWAQIGPVGVGRDGAVVTKAVESRALALSGVVEVPVAFRTTEAGDFTITWPTMTLAEGWTATLTDRVTGTTVDLSSASEYTFAHDASAAAERFVVAVASAVTAEETGPDSVEIGQVYPNPTAGTAQMSVTVGEAQRLSVSVYDAIGRRVAVAFEGTVAASETARVDLDTAGLAPGVYLVRVEGASFAESRRLVVTR